jgi:hypothetical protein
LAFCRRNCSANNWAVVARGQAKRDLRLAGGSEGVEVGAGRFVRPLPGFEACDFVNEYNRGNR